MLHPKLAAPATAQGCGVEKAPKPKAWLMNTSDTARLAPEDNPITSGPAKAFLNSVCICKPPMDKALPANIHVRAFVIRKSQTMSDQTGLELVLPASMLMISPNGISTLPRDRFMTNSKTNRGGRTIHRLWATISIVSLAILNNDTRFRNINRNSHDSPLQLAKILKPAFGNYTLVSIFAVLFEERG